MTSERPAKSRVIASWNTSIRNTEGGQGATEASLLAIDGTTGEPPTQHPEDHEDKQVDGFHELDSDGEEEGELAPVMVSESAQKEMKDFEQGFHGLLGRFKLLSKIGEGTFSSVYKAIDLEYDRYDNSGWDYSVDDQPSANEKDSTGDAKDSAKDTANNVVEPNNVESGKVVAIKRIYVTSSPLRIENEIAILHELSGHKNVVPLITAARHKDQVIVALPYFEHRDFRTYYRDLPMEDIRCYFRALLKGLAHVHSKGIIHRDVKPNNFLYDTEKKTGVIVDFGLAQRQENWPQKYGRSSTTGLHPGVPNPHASVLMANREPGFPRKDTRPVLRVNRAGTKGFRAPEVLFRHVCQTVALDIWSVGVILIAFLTGRFPFFNSDHEVEALLEIAVLFGQREMKKVAATFDRTFVTNLPSIKEHPMSITRICWSLHPKRFAPPEGYAVSLLERLLTLDPTKRITAEEALKHPFLAEQPAK
ncbi:serine/threonine protein kinase Hsk1 [Dissophora ornata]|nr:serine/threonine protein kinase Hsk1 [Dissophora ornata]